jgi:hypothetical protein
MDRDELRAEIKARRTVIHRGGPFLPCAWCGRQAKNRFEVHEVFVKRSRVAKARQGLIFVPENCVQLHQWCHQRHGQTPEMRNRAHSYLCHVEGAEKVAAWYLEVAVQLGLPMGTIPDEDTEQAWRDYMGTVWIR